MPKPTNTPQVLWNKVDVRDADECWPWLGFRNAEGYGRTWIDGKGYYAHRVIFDLANPGMIDRSAPRGRNDHGFLRHKCDNPSCCNPSHLLIGTHQNNMADKLERGRQHTFRSVDSPRAKLSVYDVVCIRAHKELGTTRKALALLYDVSVSTIKGIWSGRHYSDVN